MSSDLVTRVRRSTALYRSPAPTSPATAWVWFASIAVGVSSGISHGIDSGVRGAVIVFVAWAIVRELAPARAVPSALAPFAAVAYAIPERVDLLACAGVLVLARVALRSTGRAPTRLDQLAVAVLAGLLARTPEGFAVAVVLASVLFVDDRRVATRIAGLASLIVALVVGVLEGTITARPTWDEPSRPELALLCVAAGAAIALVGSPVGRRLATLDDAGIAALDGARLRSARVAAVAAVVAAAVWAGSDAVFVLGAAAAAAVAGPFGGLHLGRSGTLSEVTNRPSERGA